MVRAIEVLLYHCTINSTINGWKSQLLLILSTHFSSIGLDNTLYCFVKFQVLIRLSDNFLKTNHSRHMTLKWRGTDVNVTWWRCIDVITTSCSRWKEWRINNEQTFKLYIYIYIYIYIKHVNMPLEENKFVTLSILKAGRTLKIYLRKGWINLYVCRKQLVV